MHFFSQVVLTATFGVFEFMWMGIKVGKARKKYGITVSFVEL